MHFYVSYPHLFTDRLYAAKIKHLNEYAKNDGINIEIIAGNDGINCLIN